MIPLRRLLLSFDIPNTSRSGDVAVCDIVDDPISTPSWICFHVYRLEGILELYQIIGKKMQVSDCVRVFGAALGGCVYASLYLCFQIAHHGCNLSCHLEVQILHKKTKKNKIRSHNKKEEESGVPIVMPTPNLTKLFLTVTFWLQFE